jgi:hypothetical protein
MLENTTLEQYSVLEELSSLTPVWRPFVNHADDVREAQQASEEIAS